MWTDRSFTLSNIPIDYLSEQKIRPEAKISTLSASFSSIFEIEESLRVQI